MNDAEIKTTAKREANAAEREARKQRRADMALAVAEARRSAAEKRELRQSQLREAVAVAEAQKEKESQRAAAAGEALAQKLGAADLRRTSAEKMLPNSPASSVRLTVLNNQKMAAEAKRLKIDMVMAKAASNRAAFLHTVAEKAKAENEHAAAVAAAAKAPASPKAKAALFDKLVAADVSRQSQLKAKAACAKGHGDTVAAIVFRVHAAAPRMPPPALSLRLSVIPTKLLVTAAARQAGAAARRAAIKASQQMKAAAFHQKHANAKARVAAAQSAVEAKLKAKAARALIAYAMLEGRRLHARGEGSRRAARAALRRASADEAREAADVRRIAKAVAAGERRAATLKGIAKVGATAEAADAFKARRAAKYNATLARFGLAAMRSSLANRSRMNILAARVELARKRMKAPHEKREMPDESHSDA